MKFRRSGHPAYCFLLVAGGATRDEAQEHIEEHIEEQVEWFTDMYYDGLTPEEAAKAALN